MQYPHHRVPEEQKSEQGVNNLFREIKADNLSNLVEGGRRKAHKFRMNRKS